MNERRAKLEALQACRKRLIDWLTTCGIKAERLSMTAESNKPMNCQVVCEIGLRTQLIDVTDVVLEHKEQRMEAKQ
jgi:hypothetical protein